MAKTRTRPKPKAVHMGKVHETWDVDEANKMLADGWYLMHASVAHQGPSGFQAKPCYVLARPRKVK